MHFGLTSQDINNTAIPSSLRDASNDVYYPLLEQLTAKLTALSKEWEEVPLLAHTHGQPASPTKLGKEIRVFVERIEKQTALLRAIPSPAKFGGATGNFNAHVCAYPDVDWSVREPFRQRRAGTRPLADHDADRALRQHRRYFR